MSAHAENALIHRLRAKEQKALGELIDLYGDAIRRHIRLELCRGGLACPGRAREDFDSCVESVFDTILIKFLDRLDRVSLADGEQMQLLAYLKKSVTNHLYDRHRARTRRLAEGDLAEAVSPDPLPDEAVAAREETLRLRDAVERMREALTCEERE